jgi:exonuclease III
MVSQSWRVAQILSRVVAACPAIRRTLHIDHRLPSPSTTARLVSAGVDREVRAWEKASDHAPTWIVIAEGAQSR